MTLKSGHFPLEGISVGTKLNMHGVYVRAKIPLGNNFDVFAKVGGVRTKTESDVLGEIYSSTLNNFSYGVGAQYNFNKSFYGQLDYMYYYNAHGTSISGPALVVGFKF
jgi:opacity protein-like surface antigen